MLVQNFYTVMKCLFMMRREYGDVMPFDVVDITGARVEWNSYSAFPYINNYGNPVFDLAATPAGVSSNYGYPTIYIGSGVSNVTISDYKLEKPIYEGLTIGSVITNDGVDSSGYPFVEKTIQLIANAGLTIGELGWFYPTSRNSGTNKFMIDRTVLDSPLAMKNGDVSFVKYRSTIASMFNF